MGKEKRGAKRSRKELLDTADLLEDLLPAMGASEAAIATVSSCVLL